MLQEVMDGTYKAKATRDRLGKPVPRRLVVVAALRSETPMLWDQPGPGVGWFGEVMLLGVGDPHVFVGK